MAAVLSIRMTQLLQVANFLCLDIILARVSGEFLVTDIEALPHKSVLDIVYNKLQVALDQHDLVSVNISALMKIESKICYYPR